MSVDLRTKYLGLELKNPLVAASAPITGNLDSLKSLDEAGIGAVVLPSLFEEQIEHEEMEMQKVKDGGSEAFAEALSYFPKMQGDLRTTPERYIDGIKEAKEALSVPVIASINGVSSGGWVRYAKLFEEAGADAVELNVYHLAADPKATSEAVEQRYLDLVAYVKAAIGVPLAVKIGPFFSALPAMARRLKDAGADGLVMFNRFMQPDFDLEERKVVPNVELSTSAELRLPLRWIAILKDNVDLSYAATTGIHSAGDVVKVIAAGADVAMMASALLKHGPGHVAAVLGELKQWLAAHDYASVEQIKGSMSQQKAGDPEQFERANYMKALISYSS